MRCDAEANSGACNAIAQWEAETPDGPTLYCCNTHFLLPTPAEWVTLPWRLIVDHEAEARCQHARDEYDFERNYTNPE